MSFPIQTRDSRRLLLAFAILAMLLMSVLIGSRSVAFGQSPDFPPLFDEADQMYIPGELLVQFERGPSVGTAQLALESIGARYMRDLYQSDVQVWRVPEGEEDRLAASLSQEPGIVFAEPNYIYQALTTPNDPRFSDQWAHGRVDSTRGWDFTAGSSDVTIAILDTGVDLGHPDLAGKIVAGYDFVDDDSTPQDLFGHGTHLAGIAAAIANNSVGVAGVDWKARIMPVRVLNQEGSGSIEQITNGINWAASRGADVINMSLGSTYNSSAMQNAINSAHASGVLTVAAMGNWRDLGNPTIYPAAHVHVMAVSATERDDTYAYYSQYGSHNDIAAPGGEMSGYHDPDGILSTMPTYDVTLTRYPYGYSNNYDYLQGTSMATPMVAGLAGLIWSLAPDLSPDQVQTAIQETAKDLGDPGKDHDYGHGLIDVAAALALFDRPETPELLEIENGNGDGDYEVSWTGSALATGYLLESDDSSSFNSPATVYEGSATTTSVSNQPAGIHYYRVKAISSRGDSSWSNVRSVGVVPEAPQLQPITNPDNAGDYLLDWDAPDTAYLYELQEDVNPNFSNPEVRYAGSATQYDLTGQDGGTWYYRARAANATGFSAWSNVESTEVAPPPLAAPTLLEIENDDDAFEDYTVEWAPVASATGYILEASNNRYFANPTVVVSGNMTMTEVTSQDEGTWYYRVRAIGDEGKSAWSNDESTVVWAYRYLPVLMKR